MARVSSCPLKGQSARIYAGKLRAAWRTYRAGEATEVSLNAGVNADCCNMSVSKKCIDWSPNVA